MRVHRPREALQLGESDRRIEIVVERRDEAPRRIGGRRRARQLDVLQRVVEPLEGGIKKDPQTLGFLLLMTGSAMAALGGLMILSDLFKAGRKTLRPIALIGQNALLAYVVIMLGFEHVLWLTGIGNSFTSTWQVATVRSIVLTTLAGTVVWYATRKRFVLKA